MAFIYKIKLSGLILLLTTSLTAQLQYAVQSQHRYKYITVDEGLSNNNIRNICQDSEGFIWIVTKNGTNRYDGHSIITYRNDPFNKQTISSNDVNSVFSDSKNNLWFGTDVGLDLYDRDIDKFRRFKHEDLNWPMGEVFDIKEDHCGTLWIASETGLYAYNLQNSSVRCFNDKTGNPYCIPLKSAYGLLIDRNNDVWVSIMDKGLCRYHQENNSFEYFVNDPDDPGSISDNRIEIMYEDTKGNIWLGTLNNGLDLYLPESNSFKTFIPDPENNYSTRVRAIFEDLNNNFFIGTRNGLYILNSETNKFSPYANEGHNFSKLSQNSITETFIDNTGTLWIGTFSGGVNYTNLNKKKFIHYTAGKHDKHFLSGSIIYAITEDARGNLWIGADNGLNYLDRKTHLFKYYFNDPDDPNSLEYNDVKALEWDKKGNLWIGTNRGGLNYYDVKKETFTAFINDPDDPKSISGDKIYGLMCDDDNNLWIITNSNIDNQYSSVDILPDGSDTFIHLNEKAYFGFAKDSSRNVYMGGINGFWIFNSVDSLYSFISNDTLIGKVNTISIDSEKNIWIGSNKGLVRYNKENRSFFSLSEENGYPISEVFGILEDETKSLWVSTNLGLVKITNIVKDTTDFKTRVFDSEDGVQSKQFSYNAFYKCRSGELVFGGIRGFNTFFPAEIVENTVPPNVIITDLIIFNTSAPIGEEVEGRVILEKSISATDEIVLGRKQNTFTLEFAALHYANPERNTFKYKLEGFDTEWQYRPAGYSFATYTNLSAGKYTFLVTAANNDEVWNEDPVQLKITILLPWWKTWAFRVAMILAAILLVSAIILFIVNREKTKMQLVVERMKVSKLNELNMLKSRFFTNISHEIRTPLTLIITPLEKLLSKKAKPEELDSYLDIIYRNTKNLDKLIEQLLDFRKLELGNLKLEPLQGDVISFVREIVNAYNNYASEKGIELKFRSTNNKLIALYDADKIGKILNNLLSNAFKFTGKNGKISVQIAQVFEMGEGDFSDDAREKEYIEISVKDTGKGISEKNLTRIFDRFYQSDTNEEHTGTGIGLSYVKELVKIHNGKIFVESKPGRGSKFTFRIPFMKQMDFPAEASEELIQEPEREDISEPENQSVENRIMLVIDDNPDVRIIIRDHFRERYQVCEARNGKEAWATTLKLIPDVIISDILMPDMNGFDFCKKVKNDERTSHIPLLLLTALHSKEHLKKGLSSGANDYITKPFDLSILDTKIQNILCIRDSLKQKYSSEMTLQPKNIIVSSPDQKFLQKALHVVENHIADPDFDLEQFIQEVGVSRMQLYRKLHALTDMTANEFIRNIRLKRATQLLLQDTMTVSEVAYAVGFKDVSHFGKCFRQEFGINPKDYKKRTIYTMA